MIGTSKENRIVDSIIMDIEARCGLGNEWDQISENVQDDIKEEWADIILEELNKEVEVNPEPEQSESERLLNDIFITQKTLIALQVITIGTGLQSNWDDGDVDGFLAQTKKVVDEYEEAIKDNA